MAKRTRISLLIDLDPGAAMRELLAALKVDGWSTRRTAETLGVDWSQVKRWVVLLGLREVVEEARERAAAKLREGKTEKEKPRRRRR